MGPTHIQIWITTNELRIQALEKRVNKLEGETSLLRFDQQFYKIR